MNVAVGFLARQNDDNRGRNVRDYREFTAGDWDCQHDVIQWAFPTKTVSAFNPDAPVIPADWRYDRYDPIHTGAQSELQQLFLRYIRTLGIGYSPETEWRFTFDPAKAFWFGPRDHNFRRFTRIMESLHLFGCGALALTFGDFLIYEMAAKYPEVIDTRTLAFWVAARDNKLHRVQ